MKRLLTRRHFRFGVCIDASPLGAPLDAPLGDLAARLRGGDGGERRSRAARVLGDAPVAAAGVCCEGSARSSCRIVVTVVDSKSKGKIGATRSEQNRNFQLKSRASNCARLLPVFSSKPTRGGDGDSHCCKSDGSSGDRGRSAEQTRNAAACGQRRCCRRSAI